MAQHSKELEQYNLDHGPFHILCGGSGQSGGIFEDIELAKSCLSLLNKVSKVKNTIFNRHGLPEEIKE